MPARSRPAGGTVERRRDLPDYLAVLVGEPTTLGYGEVQDLIGQALQGERWKTFRVPVPLARVGAWVQERNPCGGDPSSAPG